MTDNTVATVIWNDEKKATHVLLPVSWIVGWVKDWERARKECCCIANFCASAPTEFYDDLKEADLYVGFHRQLVKESE